MPLPWVSAGKGLNESSMACDSAASLAGSLGSPPAVSEPMAMSLDEPVPALEPAAATTSEPVMPLEAWPGISHSTE